MTTTNVDKKSRREEKASRHINIIGHYDPSTLLDKSGKLIKIIKCDGINSFTKDDQAISQYKNRRNTLLKHFSSEYAFYFWEVKRKATDYPDGIFNQDFAYDVNNLYKEHIQQAEMFHKEHYLAIITKQPEGWINKGFNVFKHLRHSFDKVAKNHYLEKRHAELKEMTEKVINSLSDYKPKLLSTYIKNKFTYSEPLKFLSQLINFEQSNIPLYISYADIQLARNQLLFNHKAGVLEIKKSNNASRFAAMLSIKGYQPITYPGFLDCLDSLKIEYSIVQSFRPYEKIIAKSKLRDQQNDLMQVKDESIRQTEQINEAFDEAASGEVGFGAHHFTLVCYADTQEELNKHVASITALFTDLDITCVRENIASECAFWAQLPGNFGYIMRKADISTKNMASFVSLHNVPQGHIRGNHWGDAVTVFETITGSPYYFNFHYKDVGNFLVFGSMGSGKTVLVGFLILQSMKFGGKRIIFDKDRGLEILVRAMEGVYERIQPGIATGFNPCHLDDTPENRKFLSILFSKMLSQGALLTVNDTTLIERAVDGIYRLNKSERQFCHIASFFGAPKQGSLRAKFDLWHSDGAHAWLFDNTNDRLNLNPDVLGFDLTNILTDEICKTPALMYLTYRIEQAIEGKRGILFCDEGWNILNDSYFNPLIEEWSRTPRKKDNLFALATQVANDTIKSGVSKAIIESSYCMLFFPNPSADKKIYMDCYGLTEKQFEIIQTMPDDQHYFLLNYGRSSNNESVILRANLSKFKPILDVISAREKSLILLDQIRKEVGDEPKIWLPKLWEQLKVN